MIAAKKISSIPVQAIRLVFLLVYFLGAASALAGTLLDSTLKKAGSNDFVSYFGFVENNSVLNRAEGLVEHSYYSKNWTCTLRLSVDRANRVVHMKLGVPRPLIDDEKVCTRGRDIVKSFVLASAVDEDVPQLSKLADEIYVRGLDLQPIKVDTKTFSKFQQAQSAHMQAYKIGKGPLTNGDNAIFLESMPKLAPKASDQFEAFSGKLPRAEAVLQNCRLSFANEIMPGSKSMTVLWCETWDENFWKSVFGGIQRSKK